MNHTYLQTILGNETLYVLTNDMGHFEYYYHALGLSTGVIELITYTKELKKIKNAKLLVVQFLKENDQEFLDMVRHAEKREDIEVLHHDEGVDPELLSRFTFVTAPTPTLHNPHMSLSECRSIENFFGRNYIWGVDLSQWKLIFHRIGSHYNANVIHE